MDETNLPRFPRYGPPLEGPPASPERPAPPSARPNEREQRLAALHTLAGHTATQDASPHGQPAIPLPTALKTATPRARRVRRPLFFALGLVVLAALALGVELTLSSRPPSQPSAPSLPTLLSLNVGVSGFGCPSGLAWSPDGSRLAVLARSGVSGNACAGGPTIGMIFDARTGHQTGIVEPQQILQGEGLDAQLTQMTWSPDGTSLVFGGVAIAHGSDLNQHGAPVLVIMPLEKGNPTVLHAARQAPVPTPKTPGPSPSYMVIWDLQAGTAIHQAPAMLPPALSYRWTADGQLVADAPLSSGPATSFTGSPTATPGAASFSRWQPGLFSPIYRWTTCGGGAPCPDHSHPPLAQSFVSQISPWSPDGRYLAMGASAGALLPPASGQPLPKLNSKACDEAGFQPSGCPTRVTPDADQAFAAIEQAAEHGTAYRQPDGSSSTIWPVVPVTWRPDGQQLAAILPGDTYPAYTSKLTVTIYRTGESTPTARLSEDCLGPCGSTPPIDMPGLAWSPSGAQLALLDTTRDMVTIWGGSALP